jgi:hypothetical protein
MHPRQRLSKCHFHPHRLVKLQQLILLRHPPKLRLLQISKNHDDVSKHTPGRRKSSISSATQTSSFSSNTTPNVPLPTDATNQPSQISTPPSSSWSSKISTQSIPCFGTEPNSGIVHLNVRLAKTFGSLLRIRNKCIPLIYDDGD